ncbi:hypothetical protein P3T35_007705 [Kitasatospora sp. GP30]|nr:hypothetical protein [Kitasatospora sp. GP30]
MTTATDRARPTPGLVAKGSTVPVGAGPIGISITPGGCRAFVAYNGDGTVCVIDTVGSAGPVGIAPSRGAVTPNRLSSYMTDNGANAVSVLTSLRSVSPNQRPTRGDTLVAIAGINPAGATAARFGSPAAIIGSTRNQVTGIGPAGAGTVDGTVTTSAATGTPEPFRYVRPPPVPGVGLRPGPTTGGSTATAAGFAMTAGPAALTVPPQAAVGPVLAAVITAGGPATVLDYTHPDTSTVTAPSPVSGPVGGAPPTTITGTGPATSPISLRAGPPRGSPSSRAPLLPSPRPALTPGPVDPAVTTDIGTITLPRAYPCLAVPAA